MITNNLIVFKINDSYEKFQLCTLTKTAIPFLCAGYSVSLAEYYLQVKSMT